MLLGHDPAILVLEDGSVFKGNAWGARGRALGEIVFATGMTGYQETLTDPSYRRQIVVMTAPHVGNTGVNDEDPESSRVWVEGFVVRDPSPLPSNWRSQGSLEDYLCNQEIVGLSGIDTRALTKRLRSHGSMRAGIFSGDALPDVPEGQLEAELLEVVRSIEPMAGSALVEEVSVTDPYTIEPIGDWTEPVATVVALDLGIKSMTPYRLAERGVRVHVLPATATFEQVLEYQPDGLFFSNGPGDPETAEPQVQLLRQALERKLPYFGICLGNQILGRALGFGTYKLKFGHRGINQPVKDLRTGKVEITSQNHGFAVDAKPGETVQTPFEAGKFGRVMVSHIGLNDQVVEGLACLDVPAFSVQYHPEAASGPHDASYLFDRFITLMHDNQKGAA